jgi:transposase
MLKTFINGIRHDIEAVKNAIKYKWTNGLVEGHVNRLKNIKREMYGRASFELLRKKVILSKSG